MSLSFKRLKSQEQQSTASKILHTESRHRDFKTALGGHVLVVPPAKRRNAVSLTNTVSLPTYFKNSKPWLTSSKQNIFQISKDSLFDHSHVTAI